MHYRLIKTVFSQQSRRSGVAGAREEEEDGVGENEVEVRAKTWTLLFLSILSQYIIFDYALEGYFLRNVLESG